MVNAFAPLRHSCRELLSVHFCRFPPIWLLLLHQNLLLPRLYHPSPTTHSSREFLAYPYSTRFNTMSLSDINPQVDPGSNSGPTDVGSAPATNGNSMKDTAVNSKVCKTTLLFRVDTNAHSHPPSVIALLLTVRRRLASLQLGQKCADHPGSSKRYSLRRSRSELVLIHQRTHGHERQERSCRHQR